MGEPSGSAKMSRKRSSMDDGNVGAIRRKLEAEKKKKLEFHSKFTFRVLLPNGSNLLITFEDPDEELSVAGFTRIVKRKCDKEEVDNGSRSIKWGSQMYLEDTMGNRIQDGKIIPKAANSKPIILVLQDGAANTLHTFQDMWDVTPEPQLLVELPQEYTFETALADLIDNSLQAVWANGSGEKQLISVHLEESEISIFDSGQGMDSSKENSIAKWGTMGSSNHRSVRGSAIGGKPPYLKPFFGMYGFGGLAASMHLGGLVMVSSKTKTSKKVVTLRLEKETLVQKSKTDRIWRTAGDIREATQEEREKSNHGSFTKVHISKLKVNLWNEDRLKCMLKDIYFPYIQNDGSDESIRTSTPVEFEVNGTNLTEVEGGEVVATNLASCNAPPFVLDLCLKKTNELQGHTGSGLNRTGVVDSANARISCFYFPILQGKESIDTILEKLDKEGSGVGESFETFCRVSIRRLGRLLPDARWGRLPFMEPKRKRADNVQIPQQCFKRVKCFVETDAGFAPTTSKTDLAHKHPFTLALKNLGRKSDAADPLTTVHLEREGRVLSLPHLEKEYQEWIRAMHESYDEEVECCDEQSLLIVNPYNKKDLGLSRNVIRVLTQIRRKGQLWKASQKMKILKGAVGNLRKDLYATLEYILCEGFEGDPGEARMICRPMECPDEDGCELIFNHGNACLELRSSRLFPLDLISSGKCQVVDGDAWKRQVEKKQLKAPAFIDILNSEQVQKFGIDKGFSKGATVQAGFVPPKEIITVVRPHAFTADNMHKTSDGLDKKSIVKECMEMKMEVVVITGNECTPESSQGCDVKYSMQTKAVSRNGVHGLYCFPTEGSQLLEMFTKVGRYKFIFSLVNGNPSNMMSLEANICVEASEKVGVWKLWPQLSNTKCVDIKQLKVRLGSEIGPLYIACYDVFSNRMPFKTYPQPQIEVRRMGKPLGIKIEKARGSLTQDRMHLQISKILLGRGNLESLRPSYEASLWIGSQDSRYVEMPIAVLPGELCSVKILGGQTLENCLRPGDVIPELSLEASDAFGNLIEKGKKIKVELTGLEFQDQNGFFRKVDDQGCVNFGGLLKVTGHYGSKGCIMVSSESQMLLEKEFQFLIRELKVISGIPKQCHAGSMLENVVFGIFDDAGNIDADINGRQHALMIDLYPDNAIQYIFRHGKCTVPVIQLPEEHGTLNFYACHSVHTELNVHIKVDLIPNPQLELGFPEQCLDENTLHQGVCDSVICQSDPNDQMREIVSSLRQDIEKWEKELKRRGTKVNQLEKKLETLENQRQELNDSLLDLKGTIEKFSLSTKSSKCYESSQLSQGGHSIEQTWEEIRSQECSAGALLDELHQCNPQSRGRPTLEDVVGIVALLGKLETDLLSRALSEYLGKDNMLAIVCKSYKGVEALEQRGKIIERSGIHGQAVAHSSQIDCRFRVICLEDIRSYCGGFKIEDPQKQLIIEEPKLPNGNLADGFLGHAVNMINLDSKYLSSVTSSGLGLRETLFYHLFSCLQVYETRNHMKQARSYITDAALSLDGGLIRCRGVFDFGNREEAAVNFPTTSSKRIPPFPNQAHITNMKEQVQRQTLRLQKLEEDINHEQTVLQRAKDKYYEKKKQLKEREDKMNMICTSMERQDYFLENREHSD